MTKKTKILLQVLLLITSTGMFAQTRTQSLTPEQNAKPRQTECGSTILLKNNLARDPELIEKLNKIIASSPKYSNNNVVNAGAPSTPYIIPVVFHIIKDPNNPTIIPSYQQVQMQLASLNAAFSKSLTSLNNVPTGPRAVNTMIQFCFAKQQWVNGGPILWPNGQFGYITYNNSNPLTTIIDVNNPASVSSLPALTPNFPPNMYLNIWCVPNITSNGSGATVNDPPSIIGIASFPGSSLGFDGIIMRNDCIGNNTYNNFSSNMFLPLDKGNILAHEAGHYLGLFHTFETIVGGSINTVGGAVGCYGMTNPTSDGDLIFDTPPTKINGQIAPGAYNTCYEGYAPYGGTNWDVNDQIENFMSYIDDDYMNTFTLNQGQRMWGALDNAYATTFLNGQRSNMHTTTNLTNTGIYLIQNCGPGMLNATFNCSLLPASITCNSAAYQFFQPILPGYLSATTHTWYFGDGSSSTAVNPLHVYNTPPSTFIATLTVSGPFGTQSTTQVINVPAGLPTIVGQSGLNHPVCKGTEQTILINFPPYLTTAVISDGINTYVVNNNFIHTSTIVGSYVFPFTFTVNNSSTFSITMGNCLTATAVASFTVVNCCSNLVTNGDFEGGPTGFNSNYVLTTNNYGGGSAAVNYAFGQYTNMTNLTSKLLMIDRQPPMDICNVSTFRNLLFGSNVTGLLPATNYYVSFKIWQSSDSTFSGSMAGACTAKQNLRFSWSGGTLIDKNYVESTVPTNVIPGNVGGTGVGCGQIFNCVITTPATGVNASTIYTLELFEIENQKFLGFDLAMDNFIVANMDGALNVSPASTVICAGTPVQLNATSSCSNIGNFSLVWQPQSSLSCNTCANPIASPAVTTVYTLIAIPPISVPPKPNLVFTATVFVNNPTITAVTPTLLCYPASYTLIASGVPTVTWQPGGSNNLSIVVNPIAPTIYTASYADPLGCTNTATFLITPPTPISLAVGGNSVYCTNWTVSAAISATATGGPATFTWLPGPLFGANQNVTPSANTIYTVNATINGCPATETFAVLSVTMCCPQTTLSPLTPTLFSGATVSGPQMITNDITIGPGLTTFQSGEFLIAADVKITVNAGSELRLQGAHLYACGLKMWKGIDVLDGGHLIINSRTNVTMIEDAITAVNLDNVTASHWTPWPLEAYGAIFNKNYIAINVSNGNVNKLDLNIEGCVFSSRDMTFTPTSWPNTSIVFPDLRTANNPTLGLLPPYNVQNFSPINLILPYNTQPGHIGIRIFNMDNVSGSGPFAGVEFGNQVLSSRFNLFDMIGTGIEVTDGSLTTRNNVFQNMRYYMDASSNWVGGTGIKHTIGSYMNAGLFLSPPLLNNTPDFGNRFWDCYIGVQTENVFRTEIKKAIFRSQHIFGTFGFIPGNNGILMRTNRFNYDLDYNQFNNVNTGIDIAISPGTYDIGTITTGIYADNLSIRENYFGAHISSTIAIPNEYLNRAVKVVCPTGGGLFSVGGTGLKINSNNVDRAFQGVLVDGMDSHPTDINGNLIYLIDDFMYGNVQRGIELLNSEDNVTVSSNTLTGQNIASSQMALVYCENNVALSALNSPIVHCNDVSNAFVGFEFNNNNANTKWQGNIMNGLRWGLLLSANGIIGVQGGPGQPSANQWFGPWNTPDYHTYVIASNAGFSKLWVDNVYPFDPFNNGGAPIPNTYMPPPNRPNTTGGFDCISPGVPYPPVFRGASTQLASGENLKSTLWTVELFPNPAFGKLFFRGSVETETLHIRLIDVSGKVLHQSDHGTVNFVCMINLDLADGIYFVEIMNDQNEKIVKKLIIAN